jgi:hypothetical protein
MPSSMPWTHPDAQRLDDLITCTPPDPAGWLDAEALFEVANIYAETVTDVLSRRVPEDQPCGVLSSGQLRRLLGDAFVHAFTLGVQFQAAGGHREPSS